MKKIITGFDGAGTHSAAEYLSKGSFVQIPPNDRGFLQASYIKNRVLHCPGLSHKINYLSNMGRVYWVERDHTELLKHMVRSNLATLAFTSMKRFKESFPEDQLWRTVEYDGSEDVYYGFAGYCALFIKLKDYFLEKYFKNNVSIIESKKMPYWDFERAKEPNLTQKQSNYVDWYLAYWKEIKKDLE